MKKALLLILALVMVSVACLAGADSLEVTPGNPSGCQMTLFKTYFDLLTQSSGYTFTWADGVSVEDGYTVYTAAAGDGALTMKIYTLNDYVCYATAEGSATLSMLDSSAAQTFGEWFGASIGGLVVGMFIGENGPSALTADLSTQMTNELNPLVEVLTNGFSSDDQLAKGLAATTTVLGYPTGLGISGTVDGLNVTLVMNIAVTSADGQLAVK